MNDKKKKKRSHKNGENILDNQTEEFLKESKKLKLKGFSNPKVELEQYAVDPRKNRKLFSFLFKYLRNKDVTEFCSGTGLFTLPFAKHLKFLKLIDIDEDAIKTAKENVTKLDDQMNIAVLNEDILELTEVDCDLIVCNPPFGRRTDLMKSIVDKVFELEPKEIILLLPPNELIRETKDRHKYIVTDYIEFSLDIGKSYEFHTKDYHSVFTGIVYLELYNGQVEIFSNEQYTFAKERFYLFDDYQHAKEFSKTRFSPAAYLTSSFTRLINAEYDEINNNLNFRVSDGKQSNILELSKLFWEKDYTIVVHEEVIEKTDRLEIANRFLGPEEQILDFSLYPNIIMKITACLSLSIGMLLMCTQGIEKNRVRESIIAEVKRMCQVISYKYTDCKPVLQLSFIQNLKKTILSVIDEELSKIRERLDSMSSYEKTVASLWKVNELSLEKYYTALEKIAVEYRDDNPPSSDLANSVFQVTNQLKQLINQNNQDKENSDYKEMRLKNMEFRKKRRDILERFFSEQNLQKVASSTGGMRSVATMNNLIHYIMLLDSSENIPPEDKSKIEQCRDELVKLVDISETDILSVIIKSSCEDLYKLAQECPSRDRRNVDTLILRFRNSINYDEAWNYALRLKGCFYESLFAASHGLLFTPEALKFTIADIMYLHCNDKYEQFLQASAKLPYVRDMKPDFYIVVDDTLNPMWRKWTTDWSKLAAARKLNRETEISAVLERSNYSNAGSLDPSTNRSNLLSRILDLCKKQHRSRFVLSSNDLNSVDNLQAAKEFENSLKDPRKKKVHEEKMEKLKSDMEDYQDMYDSSEYPKSMNVEDVEKFQKSLKTDENYLIIIEVGYHTALESKVMTDYNKWKPVQEICRSLGLKLFVFTLSDSSDTVGETPWLTKHKREVLKQTMPKIFAKLTANSPFGTADTAIADISSQRFRAVLKQGHIVKTPITEGDVSQYYVKNKDKLNSRPSGAVIPESVKFMLYDSLVKGSVVKESCQKAALNSLKDIKNLGAIEKCVSNGPMAVKPVEYQYLGFFGRGMYETAFESLYNQTNCAMIKQILTDNQSTISPKSFEPMLKQLLLSTHKEHTCNTASIKTCGTNWVLELLYNLKDVKFEGRKEPESHRRNPIDILCNSPYSSINGKAKDAKWKMMRILGKISSLISGVLKDSKGLLLCPHFEMKKKLGIIEKEKQGKDVNRWKSKDGKQEVDDLKKFLVEMKKYSAVLLNNVNWAIFTLYQKLEDCVYAEDVENVISRMDPKSVIWNPNLIESYFKLSGTIMEEDPIVGIINSIENKRVKNEDNKDDRYRLLDDDSVETYLVHIQSMLRLSGFDDQPEIIMQEVKDEIRARYSGTIYEGIDEYLYKVIKLILSVEGGRRLYIYSKLCDTYNNFTSEMTMSGYKIGKIKGTDLNLICKVNSNKNTNSGCLITDSDFKEKSGIFMMDRERAILGQSAFFCLVMCCVQVIQMQRCSKFLEQNETDVLTCWTGAIRGEESFFMLIIDKLAKGDIEELLSLLTVEGNSLYKFRYQTSEEFSGVFILSRHLCGMIALWLPCILRNSRKNSKLFQMMRYPTMASMGKYAYLKGIGGKLDSPCRSIDLFILRNYIYSVSIFNLDNRSEITREARFNRSENCNKLLSYTIPGCSCLSERQMLFDIYICHFYNKEDTNYSEGSIRVLEEMGEKHIEWEEHVAKACNNPKNKYQELRLLLGVKYLTTDEIRRVKKKSSESSDESSDSSSIASGYSSVSSTVWTTSAEEKKSDISKRLMEAREVPVSMSLLMSDIMLVTKNMKKYTFGVPELVQIAAASCSSKYNDPVISSALKSPRNNEPITKISETTSILSKPNKKFDIRQGIQITRRSLAVKVRKMLNNVKRKDLSDGNKNKKFEKDLAKILSDPELDNSQFRDQINSLAAMYKSQRIGWKEVFAKGFKSVIGSDNINYLFSYIKTSWRVVKKMFKDFGFETDTPNINIEKELSKEYSSKKQIVYDKISEMVTDIPIREEKINSLIQDFNELTTYVLEYEDKSANFPNVAFQEEELEICRLENNLFERYDYELLYLCLMIILASEFNLINHLHNRNNLLILRLNRLLASDKDVNEEESGNLIDRLLTPNLSISDILNILFPDIIILEESEKKLKKFLQLLVLGVERPIATSILGLEKSITSITQLSRQINKLVSKSSAVTINTDFHITVSNLIKSSLITGRKILNKRDRGLHLPRGIRSKVIYEMYRTAKELGTSNVQEMAFKLIAELDHDFFGALAPKAQIGGDRDLLVNETKTKITIHVTESCSKSLMEKAVKNDGLVNKKLKEQILNDSINRMEVSNKQHGTKRKFESGKEYVLFNKVICILGDCSKWGPIHCPSFFSLLIQQLLKKYPDWVNYYKLVMLKSLLKEIEIPIASIEKILRAFVNNPESKETLSRLSSQDIDGMFNAFKSYVDRYWGNNKIVVKLSEWYLSKGKACFQTYNHMGQGIHHATSSLLGNVCATFINEIVQYYLKEKFEKLNVEIIHAGSSDDFSKLITVSGTVTRKDFDIYSSNYDKYMCEAINVMTGLMRCCQMLVSEKTIYSDTVAEFYSEFAIVDRVSPSPAKFILNQIINSSITSPLTLYQSIHVVSQQAMYMGLSFLSIFCLALFKQLIFINNSEQIFIKHGKNFLRSLPIFGRLYLPTFSNMTAANSGLDDLMTVKNAVDSLSLLYFSESAEKADALEDDDQHISDVDTVSNITTLSYDNTSEEDVEEVIETLSEGSEEIQVSEKDKLSSILTVLALKYYSMNDSAIYSEEFNSLSRVDYHSMFSDPFIQLVPESVRQATDKLREFKRKESDNKSTIDTLEKLGVELITQANLTESYNSEISRLDQALNSKNVVWGLAGGIKNCSISIYRQMLRAYLFENRPGLQNIQHWIDDKLSTYINDKNKKVPVEKRIRYTDFLDALDKLDIVLKHTDFEEGVKKDYNFLQENADCPVYIDNIDNKQVIIIDHEKLMATSRLLTDLIDELVNNTFKTIIKLERTRRDGFESAQNIVTKKSSIWVDDKSKIMMNNPNVVVAYLLDAQSLYSARPTNVNFPKIHTDVFCLENNFPRINETVLKIKASIKDGQDLTMYRNYLSLLTNLCRLMTSNRNHKVELYMFKNLRDSNEENNAKNLLTYSLIEGRQALYKSDESIQFHNEIVFTIKGCISLISWLDIEESEKTNLLMNLMNMNISAFMNQLKNCDCQKYIRTEIRKNMCSQVGSLLLNESQKRNDNDSKGMGYLAKFALGTKQNITTEANLVGRVNLEWEGDLSSGFFSFSCEYGSAIGILSSGKIYLSLSNADLRLFNSLEKKFLERMNISAYEQSPGTLHSSFLRLLPCEEEDGKSPNSSQTRYIILTPGGEIKLVDRKDVMQRLNKKYVLVTGSELVPVYKEYLHRQITTKLRWMRSKLILGYEVQAMEVQIPPSVERISELLKQLGKEEESRKIKKMTDRKTQFDKMGEIKYLRNVPLSSYSIMHILIKHPNVLIHKADLDVSPVYMMAIESVDEYDDKVTRERIIEDVVNPILDKSECISEVYSINLLLHNMGLTDVKLVFSGITDKHVNHVGKWSMIITREENLQSLSSVLNAISNMCNNIINKETIQAILQCNIATSQIVKFKQLEKYIKGVNLYSSELEFFIYLSAKWVASYVGNNLFPLLRDTNYAYIVYLLVKTPITITNITVQNFIVYIAPVEGIDYIHLEVTFDSIIKSEYALIRLRELLKVDLPGAYKLIKQKVVDSSMIKFMIENNRSKIKVPFPVKEVISREHGFNFIYKLFCTKVENKVQINSFLSMVAQLIVFLCGDKIVVGNLPIDLRESLQNILWEKMDKEPAEEEKTDIGQLFEKVFGDSDDEDEEEKEEEDADGVSNIDPDDFEGPDSD